MAEAASLTKIQDAENYGSNVSFFDTQVHLEIEADAYALRSYVIPVEYEVLMPFAWDKLENNKFSQNITPAEYFDLNNLQALDPKDKLDSKWRHIGKQEVALVYSLVRDVIRSAVESDWFQPGNVEPLNPLGKKDLLISPTKLFLAMQAYAKNVVDEAEAKDRIELTLDKLSTLMLIPLIGELRLIEKIHAELGPGNTPSYQELADKVVEKLRDKDSPLRNQKYDVPAFYESDINIIIPFSEWQILFAQAENPSESKEALLPLDYLDEKLRQTLKAVFSGQMATHPTDLEKIKEAIKKTRQDLTVTSGSLQLTPNINAILRADYGFVYNVVERLRPELIPFLAGDNINIYKLPYRNAPELLPVFQEIDARSPIWSREANSLSVERALSTERRNYLLGVLSKMKADTNANADSAEFYKLAEELRQAHRALFQVTQNIEYLKDELTDSGWTLLEDNPMPGLPDAKQLEVGRKLLRVYYTQVERTAYDTWVETYRERECFLFFCRTVYRKRNRVAKRQWLETVKVEEIINQKLTVEMRPVEDYLRGAKSEIPPHTYTVYNADGTENSDETTKLKSKLLVALGKLPNTDIKTLKNGDKDVRLMSLYDNGYRDQRGNSLENLLIEAENEDARARMLIILPVYERRIDGNLEVIKYIAVHNPVAPRKSYFQPRIFLVETYSHTLSQIPGHWLGPVSHTVCLFPGELRRLKLISETRLVTQKKQESRSTQRSSVEQKASVHQQLKTDLSRLEKNAKQSNWSANASGGVNFGFWNVGGGASGGSASQSSQESSANTINDRVEDSLNNISQSNEVQFVSISESTKTESETSEQTVEFHNVNQGRSVTHKFFQLLHKFRSEVELRELKLVIEYADQLVPGFDLYRTEVFKLSEIDKIFPELIEEDRQQLINRVKKLIKERLSTGKAEFTEENDTLTFIPSAMLDPKEIYVNSGSYFVDTEVSRDPATEPYIQEARDAEIEQQKAKAGRIKNEGEAIKAGKLVIPETAQVTITVDGDRASDNNE